MQFNFFVNGLRSRRISSILSPASRFVEQLKSSVGSNCSLVGVHVRRGDRVEAVADFEHGEMVDHAWFLQAMRTMANDLGGDVKVSSNYRLQLTWAG